MAPIAAEVLDYTRSQIDPEALLIIEGTGHKVLPGKRDPKTRDFSPNWDGLNTQWWSDLLSKSPNKFYRLVEICEEDFPTFCSVLLRVYNKTVSRIHPFIFNSAQQHAWNEIASMIAAGRPVFVLFLKARQLGVSTFTLAKHFWHAWRERDVATTVIAHDVKLAKTLIRTLSLFYDELPDLDYIRPKLRQQNRAARIPTQEVYFSTRGGREWRAQISTHVAKNIEARGERSKHILESEYAFYDDPQALNDSLMPQLPPIGSPARRECSVIIESTPNGQNHFYDFWQLAKGGKTEWKGIFLPWFIADDLYSVEPASTWKMTRDERSLMAELSRERKNKYDGKPVVPAQMYWRRCEINAKAGNEQDSEMAFDMEYPSDDETCFLLYESKSVFKDDMRYLGTSISQMEELAREAIKQNDWPRGDYAQGTLEFELLGNPFVTDRAPVKKRPRFISKGGGYLRVWEPPTSGHWYAVGSDAGDLQDNAVSQVICVTCGQQAAELTMHQEGTENFADASIALCRWYFNALWMPEVNNVGTILLKRGMKDWGYGNVCREEKWDEIALKKNKYGWYTNEQNKPVLISGFVAMIKDRYFRIASRELRSEMSTFSFDGMTSSGNPRFKGGGAAHDDRVMAMALAMMAVRQSPKHFAELTKKRHIGLPTAHDLGINDTFQVETRKIAAVPDAIKEYFDNQIDYGLSVNPIRGLFGGIF